MQWSVDRYLYTALRFLKSPRAGLLNTCINFVYVYCCMVRKNFSRAKFDIFHLFVGRAGAADCNQYVTKYTVAAALDSISGPCFFDVEGHFVGGSHVLEFVTSHFSQPVTARWVRVYSSQWNEHVHPTTFM